MRCGAPPPAASRVRPARPPPRPIGCARCSGSCRVIRASVPSATSRTRSDRPRRFSRSTVRSPTSRATCRRRGTRPSAAGAAAGRSSRRVRARKWPGSRTSSIAPPADIAREARDASRKVQEAAGQIRDDKIKEKLNYSRQVSGSENPQAQEFARTLEAAARNATSNRCAASSTKRRSRLAPNGRDRNADALERARDLARGARLVRPTPAGDGRGCRTTRNRAARPAGPAEGQEGQQGQQQGQRGPAGPTGPEGQQGQQGQGQQGQGQQGQGQQGQGQQGQGQQGQGQQGQQGQNGQGGQGGRQDGRSR